MQLTEYHLYRIKFIKPAQLDIFFQKLSVREIFEKGLSDKPSIELRKNNVWHIGNVDYFTENGGRFAIGRTTKTTVERFDSDTGNFIELLDDSGPYTYVYFDSSLGLLGIAKKTKVAPDVESISRKIQSLFSQTVLVQQTRVDVKVDFIPDPENFLQKLKNAYAIKRFRAYFTGPNPVDADELFQKPMSFYCQQLDADQGSVVVTGESLNETAVAAVAKSTAATGNGASALIQQDRGERPVSISFKGEARKVAIDPNTEKFQILETIQLAYQEVRG